MSDLIDRQAAIEAMNTWDWQELYLPIHFKQLLEELPTAEKRGRWIDTDTTWSAITDNATVQIPAKMCSECGKPIPQIMWNNYCPNCGAKMED